MATERALFPDMATVILYLPPWALPWLVPLGFISISWIRPVWWTLLLVAIAGSLIILKHALGLHRRILLWLGAFTSVFGAEWEIIKHGQIAPFLLLAIAFTVLSLKRGSQVSAGLSLSVLALKPHFLLPLVMFLLGARRYKTVLFTLIGIAIVFALSWFLVGAPGYESYGRLLSYSMSNRTWMAPDVGPTLRGQMLRLFPFADVPVLVVSSIVLAITYGVLWLFGMWFRGNSQWVECWLILALPIGIVTSLHCHNYDLILLLPTIAALIGTGLTVSSLLTIPVICVGFTFLAPVYGKLHYDYLLRGGLVNPFFLVLVLFSAAVTYWAMKQVRQ
jgi:hypothetical protein